MKVQSIRISAQPRAHFVDASEKYLRRRSSVCRNPMLRSALVLPAPRTYAPVPRQNSIHAKNDAILPPSQREKSNSAASSALSARSSSVSLPHFSLTLALLNNCFRCTKTLRRARGKLSAYLIAQGLDPNSITTTGCGMRQPFADDSTAAAARKTAASKSSFRAKLSLPKSASSRA